MWYSTSENVNFGWGNRIGIVCSPEMPEKSTKMVVLSGNRIGNRVGNWKSNKTKCEKNIENCERPLKSMDIEGNRIGNRVIW